jgi:hypothetical protein
VAEHVELGEGDGERVLGAGADGDRQDRVRQESLLAISETAKLLSRR